MTSVNVLNPGSVKPEGSVNANSAAGKTKAKAAHDVSFASMMNSGYSTGNNFLSADVKGSTNVQPAKDSLGWQSARREIQKADNPSIADKISGSEAELNEFEEEAVSAVAETFGISEDAVKEALEALGLTVFDLMNPQNLVQLAMQLTSENSPATLLTSPQFLDLMQEVGDISTQLMEDLALAPEQMEELVAQMDAVLDENLQVTEEFTVPAEETAEIPAAALQPKETAVTTATSGEAQSQTEEPVIIEVTQTGEPDGSNEAFTEQDNEGSRQPKEDFKPAEHSQSMPEQPVPLMTAEADIPMVQPLTEEVYLPVDTVDIIEQIAENVKLNLSQAETSLEMQLNPENLGKIYLQISAKQGAVSAQIAASNEAVKVALEAQVAELRESLNQSGVRVDAIEVTVASHEFEKNLEQNFTREQQEGERQQKQSSQRRNLHLSELDELSSVMTEEEALAAQIMRDNGNSVDLTA